MTQFKHIMKFLGIIIAIPLGLGLLVWLSLWLGNGTDWGALRDLAVLVVAIFMYVITCSLPLMFFVDIFDFNPRRQTVVSWLTGIIISSLLSGLLVKHYWPNVIEISGVNHWTRGITYLFGYGLFTLAIIYMAILVISCLILGGYLIALLLKLLWDKTR